MVADLDTPNLQHVLELRGVLHVDLEDVVVLALLLLLQPMFALVASLAPVSDEVDLSLVASLFDESLGCLVHFYALLSELERAVYARDERRSDHRDDKERGDEEPVRPLHLVRGECVEENDGDQPER